MNQFFYAKKEPLPAKEGEEQQFVEGIDSFSMNRVLRTVELENGERLVLLDDIHDRREEVPIYSKGKNPRQTGSKNVTRTVQSEIILNENDSKRFVELYNK